MNSGKNLLKTFSIIFVCGTDKNVTEVTESRRF